MNKSCFLLNFGAHYRQPLLCKIDKEFSCDFYFGDKTRTPIKKMDYSLLKGFKKELKFISLISNFNWLGGTLKLLNKNYDVFVLTGEAYCLSVWFILLYSKIYNKKVFLWTHGWYGREQGYTKFFKKLFFKLSDGLLLYGDFSAQKLKNEGILTNKYILYNSLDYDRIMDVYRDITPSKIYKDHFYNEYPTIIYIGRIQTNKRLDILLEAIKELYSDNVKCNLVCVGDNLMGESLEKMIDLFGLSENVWLYGACYNEEKIGELIFNSNICVSPGNVGLTAVHSMSYGTPVISHNNFTNQGPEFESIIENKTGSFFLEGSVSDLKIKLKKWLKISEKDREDIRQNCTMQIEKKYNPYYQLSIFKKILR